MVTLEVVELTRIPESTDVLASYEVELDDDGNASRATSAVRRYYRSQADTGTELMSSRDRPSQRYSARQRSRRSSPTSSSACSTRAS